MRKPDKSEVKETIRQLQKFDLEDEDIASKLKVTSMSVRNWRTGKTAPSWLTYDVLLSMLGKLKKGKKR